MHAHTHAHTHTHTHTQHTHQKPEPSLRQLFAFTLEVLLIPHVLVAGFAWSWFDLHFWICLAVIIHCCWATVQEGRATVGTLSRGNIRVKIPDLCRCVCVFTINLFSLLSHLPHTHYPSLTLHTVTPHTGLQ